MRFVATLAAALLAGGAAAQEPPLLALVGGTLVDGNGGPAVPDGVVLIEFAKSVQNAQQSKEVLTRASDALYSHLLCFAAEEARINRTVVDMTHFRQRAEEGAESL